jgi:hypothetical protein
MGRASETAYPRSKRMVDFRVDFFPMPTRFGQMAGLEAASSVTKVGSMAQGF